MVIKVRPEPPGALAGQALWIALLAVGLAVFGLVVQYSAGISLSSSNRTFAFERQAVYLVIALVAGFLCYRLNLERLREHRWWIFGAALVAMLAARIPGIGVSVNGSWRWIDLGFIRLQASDLGKLALVILLADLLARMQRCTLAPRFRIYQLSDRAPFLFTPAGWRDCRDGFLKPLAVVLTIAGFIALGPDLGTILLCMAVGGVMMFISGVRWRYVVPTLLLGGAALTILIPTGPTGCAASSPSSTRGRTAATRRTNCSRA